jgi:hypothetical protein
MRTIERIRKSEYAWLFGCLAILCVAAVVYVLAGADAAAGTLFASVMLPGVPHPETVTTQSTQEKAGEIGRDIVLSDVERKVTLLRPDVAPLDTMLRLIGSTPTKSFEVVWGESGFGDGYVETEVANSTAINAAGAKVTVKLSPDTYQLALKSSVYNYEDASGKVIGLYVVNKDDATESIICNVIDGSKSVSGVLPNALGAGIKLFWNGTAQNETDAQTEPFQKMPEVYSNYCQIQMCQIEQGLYDQKQEKELDWGLLEFKSDALYNFRYGCEMTALTGIKQKSANLKGNDVYLAGGLENYVGWKMLYNPVKTGGAGLNMGMFFDLGEAVFTSISGSDSRVFFMSPQLMTEYLKIIEFRKAMAEAKTELIYGLRCNQIETGFGLLNIRVHKGLGLNRPGQGCITDLSRMKMRVFDPMHWREIDLLGSGQSKVDAWALEERTTFEFRAKASHAWVYPTAGTPGIISIL